MSEAAVSAIRGVVTACHSVTSMYCRHDAKVAGTQPSLQAGPIAYGTADMHVGSVLQVRRFFYDSVLKREYGDQLDVKL